MKQKNIPSTFPLSHNIAMLYDARSIIEGHMLDKQRVFANFVITADTKTEETTTPERHFIYSRLSLATNAMGFVQLFFLTTRSMFTIPRNSFQTLSAFYLPDVTLQGYTECLLSSMASLHLAWFASRMLKWTPRTPP